MVKKNCLASIWLFSLVLILSQFTFSAPIPFEKAQATIHGWLKKNTSPLDSPISAQLNVAEPVLNEDGLTLYYIAHLDPQGFIILSADDEIEPVIAFSATGYLNPDQPNPLNNLITKDLSHRLQIVAQRQDNADAKDGQTRQKGPRSQTARLWDDLAAAGVEGEPVAASLPSISDVRVNPFLQSQWGQGNSGGGYCYNYYTPNHYPAGCVATAMAQLMRYHSWPSVGIGVKNFKISVDWVPYFKNTRGGDGYGGAYNWSQMPYIPASGLTTTQREAIGALCYDAGISVNMSYTSSRSSSSLATADTQLVDTFKFANSIYGFGFPSSGNSALWTMINSNLDAGLPVILGIDGPSGGHAVIADGYGYQGTAAYHHLNMGWEGLDDTWYQLPTIDSFPQFNILHECLYNIYPSGSGQIVSGRVTSMGGAPLENAVVSAWIGSALSKQTVTNNRGIYAFKNMAPNTTYRLSVSLSGYQFADQNIATGQSVDNSATTGNKWGINFAASNASPPIAQDVQTETQSTQQKTITLLSIDDGLPDPNFYTYTIVSLPSHGFLSEPNVGPIESVPYTMAYTQNQVIYTPCPYFGGQDTFTFRANDGGMPPSGGDSNIATVAIAVNNQINLEYGTDSNTYLSGGMLLGTGAYFDTRVQVILLQSELGTSRYITDLAIRVHTAPGGTLNNFTIRMQHTAWNTFYNPNSQIPATGWTIVYQAITTISATGWINFHFNNPFLYNGSSNLLIDFSYNNSVRTAPDGSYFIKEALSNRVLSLGSESGAHGDPLLWGDFYGKYYSVSGYIPSMVLQGLLPINPITADFDKSCTVGMPDLAILSAAWMTALGDSDYNPLCDISTPKNNAVDIDDLIVFAAGWLNRYPGL